MLSLDEVKKQAEAEVREEKMEKAKKVIKDLLRKRDTAQQVLTNVDKEIADAYATIGEGASI